MSKNKNHITVFEHSVLRVDKGEQKLSKEQLTQLQKFHGEKGVPYYTLINNGVKFCQYVGVLQIGNFLTEILPKTDSNNTDSDTEKRKWQKTLIGMLRAVNALKVTAPSSTSLKLKPNSILNLYFELFLNEVEYLLYRGLTKNYRKTEGNINALKGSLQFSKNLQHNLVRQERFFTKYTVYDVKHTLHIILYKTLKLLKKINTNPNLQSKINGLLLSFPEMPDAKITAPTFDKLVFNRKTEHYRNAIEIAKLLLLNYHPDVSKGRNHVLALMFDMNKLWEQFVYISLKKKLKDFSQDITISAQNRKNFWQPETGSVSFMKPDVVIHINKDCYVLDTKWKNIADNNPTPEDLRQLFVYSQYFNAPKVALVYPSNMSKSSLGSYLDYESGLEINKSCSIIKISAHESIRIWQEEICNQFSKWSNINTSIPS